MYTQCPKCLTYFQVSAEHLKVAQGNVRCGQCSNVFSALGNLSEMPPQGADQHNNGQATKSSSRGKATRPAATAPANSSSQSKLTNAIAAIQALNQSSQQFLTQSRKNYVTQLQRQAQAKRKYTNVDGRGATARDLNRADPANDKLSDIDREALEDNAQDFNFDEALAAVDQIDIDIEQQANEDLEAPIQYGSDDAEDITPAYDGSHLVEDYNVELEEPTPAKKKQANKASSKQTMSRSGAHSADEFDFSNLDLPDTDDKATQKKVSQGAQSATQSKRQEKTKARPPVKKKAVKQKTQPRRPVKKTAARTQPQKAPPQSEPEQPMVIENNIPTLAIPKQLLEDFQQEPQVPAGHYRSVVTWGVGSLLLMFLFLAQTIYFKHNELGQISQLRPWIEFFCKTASCELDMQTDISQIELLGQDIRTHSKTKQALMVSATIINNAPFTQPYPGLRLSFSDMNGEKVAMRNFLPKDYLPSGYKADKGMESNVPIQLELEIVDPGKSAVNFEFDFFSI
ncbi:MAG: DUF3426 domain-containing protein [Gammaproteobacteria bacterium]|jgi:predicted Zn finger-like uncharacterized protein